MAEDAPEPSWGEADWSETEHQLEESGKLQHSPDLTKMMRTLRVLIVGGGALGQVYGYHLSLSGAHVTMFVKPKYAADNEDGCALHVYGVAGKRPQRHFQPDVVISDVRTLREHTYDQVWLCVPSPALRDGFLDRLHRSCITAGIWVTFQPDLDYEFLTQTIPAERIVCGAANFIAYRAPLAGEQLWPEGFAYFIPPWSMTKFSGRREDVENLYASAVANALQMKTGSLVAAVVPDAAVVSRMQRAVFLPCVLALESLNWSLAALEQNQAVIDLTRAAITELQVAIERRDL